MSASILNAIEFGNVREYMITRDDWSMYKVAEESALHEVVFAIKQNNLDVLEKFIK